MSLEIAWKQNILVIDSNLLKLQLLVRRHSSVCGFRRQNIFNVISFVRMLLELFIKSFSLSNNSNLIQLETKTTVCWPYIGNHFIFWKNIYIIRTAILNYFVSLPAEMFGGSDFWLETRVIIKILTHPCYPCQNFSDWSLV